jgi:hypothetical protein
MEYICIIIEDQTKLYLELDVDLVGQSEQGSGCICPACVNWGLYVAVDGSQVIDLLSWAYTFLWEWEELLLSYHGFWLFLDRRLRVDYWVEV